LPWPGCEESPRLAAVGGAFLGAVSGEAGGELEAGPLETRVAQDHLDRVLGPGPVGGGDALDHQLTRLRLLGGVEVAGAAGRLAESAGEAREGPVGVAAGRWRGGGEEQGRGRLGSGPLSTNQSRSRSSTAMA
jgi:hypothetical protein